MITKLVKDNLLFVGENGKLLIHLDDKPLNLKQVTSDIIISKKKLKLETDKLIISAPGEYEMKDIFVYALNTNGVEDVNLFSIDIDGINVVYLDSSVKSLRKSLYEQIGVVDVLIVSFSNGEVTNRLDLVREFDPAIFVPLTRDKDVLDKIAKHLEIELPKNEKKLKLSSSQFGDVDSNTVLALLQ